MKKIISIFMCFALLLAFSACSSSEQTQQDNTQTQQTDETVSEAQTEAETETQSEDGKILVVYYSATGNTETVASYIAEATGADIFKLEPVDEYSDDDLDWTDSDSRVSYEYANEDERNVELVQTSVDDWDTYSTVFIGYPIWWGIASWVVNGFVESNDFTGKTVIPFCTSSSSGIGESGELLAQAAESGNWLDGERFSSSATQSDVTDWVEGLEV